MCFPALPPGGGESAPQRHGGRSGLVLRQQVQTAQRPLQAGAVPTTAGVCRADQGRQTHGGRHVSTAVTSGHLGSSRVIGSPRVLGWSAGVLDSAIWDRRHYYYSVTLFIQ